jgi:hypothetical protein
MAFEGIVFCKSGTTVEDWTEVKRSLCLCLLHSINPYKINDLCDIETHYKQIQQVQKTNTIQTVVQLQ